MQGKLGKAVRICHGHATVIFLREILRIKSERSLSHVIYFCERRSVYENTIAIAIIGFVYPFPQKQKRIFLFTAMSGNHC